MNANKDSTSRQIEFGVVIISTISIPLPQSPAQV